jgi:hypothetical protein
VAANNLSPSEDLKTLIDGFCKKSDKTGGNETVIS